MNVIQLIEKLSQYPLDAKVIFVEELGASELDVEKIDYEDMNYIEYPPYNEGFPPYFGWEYPSNYKRKVLKTEKVVTVR